MSWNARRSSIVLLALFVAGSGFWLDRGHAQKVPLEKMPAQPALPALPGGAPKGPDGKDAGMNPDGFLHGSITLPKDEKGRAKQIEAAIDYINDGDWATAIDRLQRLLEIDEDVFVRLKRKNDEGKDVFVWVSAKKEADRLVNTLPAAGMDFYKATYGARAADLLKKAKKEGDPSLLAQVMKKYAHTDAGGEAIKLLADYHLDRGNYIASLLCYSKLFNRQGADKLPPEVIAKAWTAAKMSPASSSSSTALGGQTLSTDELWKRLRESGRELKFGEQTIALDDFAEYVTRLERPNFDQNATDSIVYRATPSRSNQLVGGPAFLSSMWKPFEMFVSGETLGTASAMEKVNEAVNSLKGKHQPIIPAFAPITVTIRKGEERKPLLIYKNYYGVVAYNLSNGQKEWDSPSDWSLQGMVKLAGNRTSALNNWWQFYQSQHPQILFENSTVGSLSTDGQFVYLVEDLAVPPPHLNNANVGGFPGGNNPDTSSLGSEVQTAINRSVLKALSLEKTGSLSFEVGGEEKGPLADSYFLGPPLPLAGKLYLLAEKQQEIRLVCFDVIELAPKPHQRFGARILSTQTLGMTAEKMQNDVIRRTSAAHLAYGEGILVCPTNAGAVFGVNLLENSLVWAYPYRDKSDVPEPSADMGMMLGARRMGRVPAGWVMGPDGQFRPVVTQHNQWKTTAPVISDGKVVFTAPDARSLHCVNLRDGSPIWRKSKLEDDLYLGNVYNGKVLIVGRKHVRGLSLSTGETLWTLETGLPSGQGIGSDNVYYLPLQDGGKNKEPQIAAIDMEHGKIISTTKARPRVAGNGGKNDHEKYEIPGNLLFYEGKVISLNAKEVVVYPQIKLKIAEMDDRIAKNPNDPIVLTERGDLRLDKGDLAGAIEDLSTALRNNPDKETRERARGKLYDTLTAYITDHFSDAERYLDEYEKLCSVEIDSAPADKREGLQSEQRRRRATFLWLVGKGREEQGRLVEAFEKYQQFAAEAGKQSELVPAVDDRQVKAAPDVWSRGRIVAMMKNATPENRQPLENLIADKWNKLRQTNDLNELRSFVRLFGSVSSAGKEARLELAERLMERKDSGDEHPLLEAELELNQFRTGAHSPELAARATEALARLYVRKGLLEDAAYCYRKLGKDYAGVIVRDGKTGRQIHDDDAATDKRLIPYLDDPQPLGSVHEFKHEKKNGSFPMPEGGLVFQFEHNGEALPYFRHHIVGLKMNSPNRFMLFDRDLEDERHAPKPIWTEKISPTNFQMLTMQVLGHQLNNVNAMAVAMQQGAAENCNTRFSYSTVGHLIVLPLAHRVFGIDPVNRRVLWEKNLAEGGKGPDRATPNGPQWNTSDHPPLVDPRDGSVLLTYENNWAQRLGQVSPFEGQTICLQSRETLSAVDPISGRTLWTRIDVSPRNFLFSDDEYVFVVELDENNHPHATRVFRALDGITVKAPDFSAQFGKRLQVFGRYLLLSETTPTNSVVVRLYNAMTGKDEWKQTYPARSLVARGDDATLTGVVEPDGKVHVIDLRARKEVMSGELMDAGHELKGVTGFHLLADRYNYYFASQSAAAANAGVVPMGNQGGASAVMTNLGMRTVPVNGYLHAFNRQTGVLSWNVQVSSPPLYLILDQFQDLPLLFLTSRVVPGVNAAMPGMVVQGQQTITVMSIEKQYGKRVFYEEGLPPATTNFFGIRMDKRANAVELLSQHLKIVLTSHLEAKTKQGVDQTPLRAPAATPRSQTSGARNVRPALDRAGIHEITAPSGER